MASNIFDEFLAEPETATLPPSASPFDDFLAEEESPFDAFLDEGVEEPEKPGLIQRTVDFAGRAVEKGKEFISGLFQEGAAQPDPSLTPQELPSPELAGFPAQPLLPEAELLPSTAEELREVAEFQPKPEPELVTDKDRKAIAQILIDTGNESLAGRFVQGSVAFGRGVLKSVPGVQTVLGEKFAESPQGQVLEEEFPAESIAGAITGTIAQVIAGGAATAAALAKTAVAKSPILMTSLARALPATVLRGAQTAEQVAQGKIDISDGLFNTIVESGGGAAFSIIPEIIFSPGVAQLIVQPLADIVYQAGVDLARGRGKDVLGPEWFKEQIPTIAASLGFAIKDVASGAEFRTTQKAQRAEIKNWLGGKGEAGYEIIVTPEGAQILGEKGLQNIENIRTAEEARLKGLETQERPTQKIDIEEIAKFKPEKEAGLKVQKVEPREITEKELSTLPTPEKVPTEPVKPSEAKVTEEEVGAPVKKLGDVEGVTELKIGERDIEAEAKVTKEVDTAIKKSLNDAYGKFGKSAENSYINFLDSKSPSIPEGIKWVKDNFPKAHDLLQKTFLKKVEEPTPTKGTEAEKAELVTRAKEIRKETETATTARESQLEKLDVELERVEAGSDVRKSLTGFEEKAITGKQWDLLTGKSTRDRQGNLIVKTEATEKVLQSIADDYNLGKAEGEDATTRLLPSDRILQSVDNWSADDVADLIKTGVNVREFKQLKADIEGQREAIETEAEQAFTDIGKRGEEISAKQLELGIGPTGEERFVDFFETGQREGILEAETGAVRTDIFRGRRAEKGTKRAGVFAKMLQRNFTSRGDLPEEVFREKVAKDSWLNAELKDIENNVIDFRRAAGKLSDKEAFDIDLVFKGEKSPLELPEKLQPIIKEMRNHVDALSQRLIDEGVIEGDLATRVQENIGFYATRSYRVFDEPKWADKVPPEVRNRAKGFVRNELEIENLDTDAKIQEIQGKIVDVEDLLSFPREAERVDKLNARIDKLNARAEKLEISKADLSDEHLEGLIDNLLYKEGAPVNILSSGSKLGARNLSILKARKDIPPEIRALWGEYKNADVNYARSVAKMGQLLANNRFLTNVGEAGAEKYFFKEPVVKEGISYSVKISAEDNPSMKPLDGLHTTKEIKKAFEDAVAKQSDPEWLRLYLKLNSTVKYAKTIGSAMTHIRNVTGNVSFAIANGHFNDFKAANTMVQAAKLAGGDLVNKTSREQRNVIREYVKLGIVADGARSGEIRAIIKDASQGDIDVLVGTPSRRVIQRGLKLIEKAYGAEDDVWKIFAFESEMKRYRNADTGMSEAELRKFTAKIVRDTYPTYSQIPRAIKALRRFPLVGTFVSFPAEVMRTAKNTIGIMATELKSSNPKVRQIGAERLSGIMIAATLTAGITTASRYMFGITRKKDEAVREFVPPWSKNSQIVYKSQVDEGKGTYIDLGYTDPHSYLKSPLIAFMRGEDWEQKIIEAGAELLSPFLSEDIMAQKFHDIKRNKDLSGDPIWNDEDAFVRRWWDGLSHVAEAIEPGTISGLRRIWKATKEREGRFGTSYDVKTEIAAQTTGVRINTLDVKRSLKFKTFEFQRRIREAARLAHKRNIPTSFVAKSRIFTNFADIMQKAKLTGLTQVEVNIALNEAGMSWNNIAFLMTGTYEEILKSKEMVAEFTKDIP